MQCSGSVTFWYGSPCGSGSLDPYLWLTVPDPDLDADSALVVSELQYVTSQWSLKKIISNFLLFVQGEKRLTALDGSCQPSTGQKSLWMAKHTTVSNDHASDFFSFPLFCEAKQIGLYQNWPKESEAKWFYFKFWRKVKMFDGNFVFLKAKKRNFHFFKTKVFCHSYKLLSYTVFKWATPHPIWALLQSTS